MNKHIFFALWCVSFIFIVLAFWKMSDLEDKMNDIVERTIVVEKRIILHDLN